MSIKLIGIGGLLRAGKDTFAVLLKDLLERQGRTVHIARWADPLKQASLIAFGYQATTTDEKNRRQVVDSLLLDAAVRHCAERCGLPTRSWCAADWTRVYETFRPFAVNSVVIPDYSITPREFEQLLGTEVMRAMDSQVFVKRLQREADDADYTLVTDTRFANEFQATDTNLFIFNPRINRDEVPKHASERIALMMDLECRGFGYTRRVAVETTVEHQYVAANVVHNDGDMNNLKYRAIDWTAHLLRMEKN